MSWTEKLLKGSLKHFSKYLSRPTGEALLEAVPSCGSPWVVRALVDWEEVQISHNEKWNWKSGSLG